MPGREAPCTELGNAPYSSDSLPALSSPSELSSASSPEPHNIQASPLFRALAVPPPLPPQLQGQEDLERRLPGFRRVVIPRELTLIELLKQSTGVRTDEEVLQLRDAKLRVMAERVGLRLLHVLVPRLRSLTLDGSVLHSIRDLGTGLTHLKELRVCRCGLTSLDGVLGLRSIRELYAAGNDIHDPEPLACLRKMHTLDLSNNPISESSRIWTLGVCGALRRLSLRGSDAASKLDYKIRIASALPSLEYLDDLPLNQSASEDLEEIFGPASSSSDSESEEADPEPPFAVPLATDSSTVEHLQEETDLSKSTKDVRRRPATTECAGARPPAPRALRRPHTAQPHHLAVSKLELLNRLIDEEDHRFFSTPSTLTSGSAVCGNLARALRRPTSASSAGAGAVRKVPSGGGAKVVVSASCVAAEIPLAPRLEDWARFRETTGIEFELDFTERPKDVDPARVLYRLEEIEKETRARFRRESLKRIEEDLPDPDPACASTNDAICNEYPDFQNLFNVGNDAWGEFENLAAASHTPVGAVDDIFLQDVRSINSDTRQRQFGNERQNSTTKENFRNYEP